MAKSITQKIESEVKREVELVENKADKQLDVLVEEDADSVDSNVRYAAYLRRIRDVVRAGSRYTAYTSDVGEAFRPVVPPWVVTAAYGISWAYLIGDVAFTTYKAKEQGPTAWEAANFSEPTRLSMVAVKRSVFQGLASMALPAFTIHTAVAQTAKAVKNSKNVFAKRWLPSAVGIGIVPFLPYLFDHPVEYATDRLFDKIKISMAKDGSAPPEQPKHESKEL
ncbi:hypothetical protein CcaverHIS002_0504650 [Cutaneotrichosporon cavernicola]|uniref:Mitochondrial fission process protein 1 n=1 Tax=Cutaneotrichosporon cavernicola TaxID=279322 RepID=A0AA48L6M0_9TREE|nr:uncharacterized protein CcaverHIS019_0505190 [Cutaneotrichosporon cavernicola]BEI85064.1 hypothetical protein CcaverHIS002_0504650 [Cutaneotrichosporon cavernicola]BEI92891.1 hypothetical protein CcaverHIS019_0505190 [Cutaneotrichosporon cavernicola]BEJ00667.1 hypothetical protein CcaverHIS631_0505240 [Cutaneotrichosporon cavernicola]BEJ08433.1 hypothetical protein CcaverHIS641_0505180 [Cutaneotrichosporon cavernicola]